LKTRFVERKINCGNMNDLEQSAADSPVIFSTLIHTREHYCGKLFCRTGAGMAAGSG